MCLLLFMWRSDTIFLRKVILNKSVFFEYFIRMLTKRKGFGGKIWVFAAIQEASWYCWELRLHDVFCEVFLNIYPRKACQVSRDVHRIAILDIRILNCDRNEENILVKKCFSSQQSKTTLLKKDNSKPSKPKVEFELIPIDHGLSFPDSMSICR